MKACIPCGLENWFVLARFQKNLRQLGTLKKAVELSCTYTPFASPLPGSSVYAVRACGRGTARAFLDQCGGSFPPSLRPARHGFAHSSGSRVHLAMDRHLGTSDLLQGPHPIAS